MLQLRYDELKKSLDAFTVSSVDNLLDKIRYMASCPISEFNKFESLDLLEALKNAAQDTKHEKAGYYKFAFETGPCVERSTSPTSISATFFPLCLGTKIRRKF